MSKYTPREDGEFYCADFSTDTPDTADCKAHYAMPQHLGLHRLHEHGIKSQTRKPGPKTRAKAKSRKSDLLTAEDVCRAVLEQASPDGRIAIVALKDYEKWVDATEDFLTALYK